jgi:hypothetical protein
MQNRTAQKDTSVKIAPERLAMIDRLLAEAIRVGPSSKRRAISKVLRDFPEFTRGNCWQRIRYLRKSPEVANLQTSQQCGALSSAKADPGLRPVIRAWTAADDDKLLNWAGYEPVNKIALRLSRSERAVRFRLCALGISAKVTDGWSLRALRQLLRLSPGRLRQFVGTGKLRVRDARVTAHSLATFCDRNRTSLDPLALERIAIAMAKKRAAYPWERVANLFGVAVAQVQSWIAAGQLKVLDTFVTDRSFEEFCKKHGSEINTSLIDPATAKWLIEEYGVAPTANRRSVSPAQKHALVTRTCNCGRKIAGNAYFRHAKVCELVSAQPMRPVGYESGACGTALASST